MPSLVPPPAPASPPCLLPARWDIFCRVIDNHGDLGVCWRLACEVAQRGMQVRLWIDDASALAWMAPHGAPGVQVMPWRDPWAEEVPGDVVIEAFGCDPPTAFVARMAAHAQTQRAAGLPPPVWVNLEYLSAESYVERSHGLSSPQWSGPGQGLTKWFFYPGFTERTGGLLREAALAQRQTAAALHDVWQALALPPRREPQERFVLLFGYEQPLLPAWLPLLSQAGQVGHDSAPLTTLLVTPGYSAAQVRRCLGVDDKVTTVQRGALRVVWLPYLEQAAFDTLLAGCDLNLVRGEDSLVRALWAGKPMLWQLYVQDDGAHVPKLEAFLTQALDQTPAPLAQNLRQLARLWNGAGDPATLAPLWQRLWHTPEPWQAWQLSCAQRSQRWAAQPDLVTQLLHWLMTTQRSPSHG